MTIWRYARAQWDRTLAGAFFVLGALALVLGWNGVSREALTALQIPYILSGGLGGIFLLGLGAVFWMSADMRDEWRKLDDLERTIAATQSTPNDPLADDLGNGVDRSHRDTGTPQPKRRQSLRAR